MREDQQTAYILYGAGVSPWQREIYSPPRALRAGGLLEEAATLLVTYFDSVCEPCEGESVPLGRAHTHPLCSACGAGLRIATVRAMSITF